MHIRKLSVSETKGAHALIARVTAWLKTKNIRQWDSVLPLSVFSKWVAEASAYGVFESVEQRALFVLRRKSLSEYDSESGGSVLWLSTVCVDRNHAGLGIGKLIVDFVKSRANEDVFLDCADNNGALPRLYAVHGFVEVSRKRLYGKQMVLMRWHNEKGPGKDT